MTDHDVQFAIPLATGVADASSPAVHDQQWDRVIRPKGRWFDLGLQELWRYRDLVFLFVRRDFVAQYKQTILGPLWYLINPILTTLVFTVVFGTIAKVPTDGVPPFVFYLAGTTVWSYFARCLTATSNTFVSNAAIFGKVYFPRLVVPVARAIACLIHFGIQFALFVAVLLVAMIQGANVHPGAAVVLLPVLLCIMAALGLGLGILASSLTTKYRDLGQLISFGVQLLMYATPIVYPLSAVPGRLQQIVLLNPLTPVVEAFRFAFLGQGSFRPVLLMYSAGFALLMLLAGALLFNRVEHTFMDTV